MDCSTGNKLYLGVNGCYLLTLPYSSLSSLNRDSIYYQLLLPTPIKRIRNFVLSVDFKAFAVTVTLLNDVRTTQAVVVAVTVTVASSNGICFRLLRSCG